MAAIAVCKFNQFGYCRYQETCRNHHVNELCENEKCEMDQNAPNDILASAPTFRTTSVVSLALIVHTGTLPEKTSIQM